MHFIPPEYEAVRTAFRKGAIIEYRDRIHPDVPESWRVVPDPTWNWALGLYRVSQNNSSARK